MRRQSDGAKLGRTGFWNTGNRGVILLHAGTGTLPTLGDLMGLIKQA